MVPSRSRKTAGRSECVSGRMHLQSFEPEVDCAGNHRWRNIVHTAVIRGATAQKTRAAVGFLLYDTLARSYGGGAIRVSRAKDRDDGQAKGCRNMHCARIIP